MPIALSSFESEDFEAYKSWFADPDLNKRLGPIDQDWLDHVLQEESGYQYSAYDNDQLVGVVGVVTPNDHHPYFVITDIAVNPAHRRRGIARAILTSVMSRFKTSKFRLWRAYIGSDNIPALALFRSEYWSHVSEKQDDEDMVTLERYQ